MALYSQLMSKCKICSFLLALCLSWEISGLVMAIKQLIKIFITAVKQLIKDSCNGFVTVAYNQLKWRIYVWFRCAYDRPCNGRPFNHYSSSYIARYVKNARQNKVVVVCWNKSQTFLYIYPNGKWCKKALILFIFSNVRYIF